MPNKVSVANFSSSNASLSTVGYAIYNSSDAIVAARTTSGVVEIGTATGIYKAIITYPPNFKGYVLWDTGAGTPDYASESINPLDPDSIADEVRTMLRNLNISLLDILRKKPKDFPTYADEFGKVCQEVDSLKEAVLKIKMPENHRIDLSGIEASIKYLTELSLKFSPGSILKEQREIGNSLFGKFQKETQDMLTNAIRELKFTEQRNEFKSNKSRDEISKVIDGISERLTANMHDSFSKFIEAIVERAGKYGKRNIKNQKFLSEEASKLMIGLYRG